LFDRNVSVTPSFTRFRLSEVIIHEDENFERALKRFKKKCEKAGILSDLRKHRHYEKPSERRKRKMNAAVRKNRRTRSG
jgi:small subunit ribosomal protein S21